MAATAGMIETVPKITPTSIATSLGTPHPATVTTTPTVTTDRGTISRNKRSALTLDIPKVIVAFVFPDAASVLAHTEFDPRRLY
jgi:hypothetical protein